MKIIPLKVENEYVEGAGIVLGAMGSHDSITLRVTFDDEWAKLYKYATFRNSKGYNPKVVILTKLNAVEDMENTFDVLVPGECMEFQGLMSVTFTGYGITEDGNEESESTNTTTAKMRVLPSDYMIADDGSVTPTLAQQLQTQIDIISSEQGTGVPLGGTEHQLLRKKSDASFDMEWFTPEEHVKHNGSKLYDNDGVTQIFPETKMENITDAEGSSLDGVITKHIRNGIAWKNVASGETIPEGATETLLMFLCVSNNASYGYESMIIPRYLISLGIFQNGFYKVVYSPTDTQYYSNFTFYITADGVFTYTASSENPYYTPTLLCHYR